MNEIERKLRKSEIHKRYYKKHKAKICAREKLRRLSPEWKKRWIDHKLRKKYGITLVQKEQMVLMQNHCCAICGNKLINIQSFCVDHNHATGKARGLLCSNCNWILGLCKENVFILEKAILYLKKWNNGQPTPDV